MPIDVGPEQQWSAAIVKWKLGLPDDVARLLAGHEPIPEHARQWLASLARGDEKRWRGLTKRTRLPLVDQRAAVPLAMSAWRKICALDRFEALKAEHAADRLAARKSGRDCRGLPDAAAAALQALAEQGFKSEADPLRTIRRMQVELNAPADIDLNYRRKG